ncbi:MAG: hypothetical protein JXO44_07460, partial [Clostridia bacterium]|nr:hypothetical protein [Clostridia bacterium]
AQSTKGACSNPSSGDCSGRMKKRTTMLTNTDASEAKRMRLNFLSTYPPLLSKITRNFTAMNTSFYKSARLLPGPRTTALAVQNVDASINIDDLQKNCYTFLFTRYYQHNFIPKGKPRMTSQEIKHWFDNRSALFHAYTLPSVLGQKYRSFIWCILVDEKFVDLMPNSIKTPIDPRIELVAMNNSGKASFEIEKFVEKKIHEKLLEMKEKNIVDAVVTTARLDNDDAISNDFVLLLNSLAASAQRGGQKKDVIISFTHGLQYLLDSELRTYLFTNNHFLGSAHFQPEQSRIHSLSVNHGHIFKIFPDNVFVANTDLPMWIETIHGENLTNQYGNTGALRDNKGVDARFSGVYKITG